MRLVVVEGTGRKANAAGYMRSAARPAPRTSWPAAAMPATPALLPSSGPFPWTDPRYVVFVMVDEPKPTKETHGYATGGWVAAPVMPAHVIERIGAPGRALRRANDDNDHDRADAGRHREEGGRTPACV